MPAYKYPMGHPKYGGRTKGTPNKTQHSVNVTNRLDEFGVDLLKEIWTAIAAVEKPDVKARLLLDLMDYCAPKRKAIEVTQELTVEEVKVTKENLSELYELARSA